MHERSTVVMAGIPETGRRSVRNVDASRHSAKQLKRPCVAVQASAAVTRLSLPIALALMAPSPARAVDGCVVLLCLAAPNWRAIPQCVPPVRQLLRDLARGRAFPTCAMAGAGNSSSHVWATAPGNCPPQYTQVNQGPNGPIYSCHFVGAISVSVQGAAFTRTWWSPNGDSVTEYSPAAKSQLGSWDARFDDDLAAWQAANPVPASPAP